MTPVKAIALLSGGLDSILAAKIISDLGIEVIGVHFLTPFSPFTLETVDQSAAAKVAGEIGIKFVPVSLGEEYLELLKHPKFGFGSAANPCIDCHAFFIKKAGQMLKDFGASFIVTGEVMGQRPMSQRAQAMSQIDKETGLKGHILRPLSAKLMNPTVPEEKKWVDREKLFSISGRSRKEQYKLAEKFKLKEFSAPAGGCLLTMEDFGRKVKDLLKFKPDFNLEDVKIMKLSRNFRLSPAAKLVVGKNDLENKKIISLALAGDLLILTDEVPGPAGLVRGKFGQPEVEKACAIIAYYVHKCPTPNVPLILERIGDNGNKEKISSLAMERQALEELRIK
jgi:tRNA U34 2-thiouridine synthase MnmA/TrmU